MQFLLNIHIICDKYWELKYNKKTLNTYFKGKNIAKVLKITVEEAQEKFQNILEIKEKLNTSSKINLRYIELGQSSLTLPKTEL